jgi:deoxycytidylate deaminase
MSSQGTKLELLDQMTIEQAVTSVKLAGSAGELVGRTTPEGYPFIVVIAVGKPGNERALELARRFFEEMLCAGAPVDLAVFVCPRCHRVSHNPNDALHGLSRLHVDDEGEPTVSTATCSECARPVVAKGLCATHYQRAHRRAKGAQEAPSKPGGASVTVGVRLRPAKLALVRVMAEREEVDASEWLRRAVDERLNAQMPGGAWVGPPE